MIVFGTIAALVLAAGALYQFVGSRASARRYTAPGVMIAVDGQRLHVVCDGHGQPSVLFESGIAASSLSWSRVLPEVAAFTHACAYDRAGLGWSDPCRAQRTVSRMLRELRGVLHDRAASGPAVLVGHSFGALLVCAYASANPAAVAGLVLLDPPSEWHHSTPQQARLLRGGIQLSRVGGLLARFGIVRACLSFLTGGAPAVPRNFVRLFGSTAARTLERLVGEVRKLPPDVHPVVQALWCQPKCFQAMARHLAALDETAAAAGRVRSFGDIPLVIVSSGDQSPETIEKHRALARLSSHGGHITAAGTGHWIQFDDPALVVAVVRNVVECVRRANGRDS
jgi:pimeloyl-ACP methyl ester carboxylesterase